MRKTLPLAAIAVAASLPFVAHASGFRLDSPDINSTRKPIANKHVFNGFGCEGENVSPAVVWQGAPKDTKSFALTVYDPDAPTGSGWWHWVVIDIPAESHGLPQGAGNAATKTLPAGARQIRTDYGVSGWGGPCPPKGDKPHRYIFTVHALKTEKLDVPADATAALVGFMINANRLGKATFEAKYGRK